MARDRVRVRYCVYCGKAGPRVVVVGGFAHRRCIPRRALRMGTRPPSPVMKGKTRKGKARERRFVKEYAKDLNGKAAAQRAGFAKPSAHVRASQLLARPDVQAALKVEIDARMAGAELTSGRVLEELRRLAFVDVTGIFDEFGNVKPFDVMPVELRSAIHGIETVLKNAKAGDGVTDEVLKVKTYDKTKALEMLCKYFGLLVERIEVTGTITLAQKVAAARKRLQEGETS